MTATFRIRLGRKIEKLNKQILAIGAQVEDHLRLAVKAVVSGDPQIAAQVIDGDIEINMDLQGIADVIA